MKHFLLCVIFSASAQVAFISTIFAEAAHTKKVLIVVEGGSDLRNYAMGDGRQLATLMGHFPTVNATLKGVINYRPHEINSYDYVFYIGFYPNNPVPGYFLDDIIATHKPIIWLNTGFVEFCRRYDVAKRYGFIVTSLDSVSIFNFVRTESKMFTKGEPITGLVKIKNRSKAKVIATAYSSKKRKEIPYIVRSDNLLYFADSPFASAGEGDRYLLFADMLHDILQEQHGESHQAIVRIEDVDPLENPDKLREVADILSARGIPFLVGVVPYHIDPGEGIRVSLSDKPQLVDALQYMVRNGGTIAMHGITHQYKGSTGVDYEFWDESTNKPIKEETAEGISRKIEMGLQEFLKNGLFPLVWETPHYTASFRLYRTVSQYFSTACEQRLSIEDADYSQQFPFLIKKDLFGQTIYPENLGFVPMHPHRDTSMIFVQNILKNAKALLNVRDGIATFFFHPFLDLRLIKELADGMLKLGYTFIDLREQTNWVRTKDRIILSGNQTFTLPMNDQYLVETYFDRRGEITSKTITDMRLKGEFTKTVTLAAGEFYKAEPSEYREKRISFVDNISFKIKKLYENTISPKESWQPVRAVILWNHFVKGAAFNDQASLASVFRSVNVIIDTIFLYQHLKLQKYNLVIVPYAFVDSLTKEDYTTITTFVEQGGNLITDMKNDLAEELGINYTTTRIRVSRISDSYFPLEHISWRYGQLITKLDAENVDEIFCVDEATNAPVAVGKSYGKGRFIYFASMFDPHSQLGYSLYPYLLEYVRKYFGLRPFIRRENLEVYFDPGLRHAHSVENLIQLWVQNGIRVVHVAGWHQYPKYTYDYHRLIHQAHANGILVYAWLEPPQVNHRFWNDHPEWREKNYKGEDVRPSWRYPVALTDTKCRNEVMAYFRRFLESYDFDGVNLGELYFEAGRGFEDPLVFTPMHPSVCAEVMQKYGIDLPSIFDPEGGVYWKSNPPIQRAIVEYRVEKLTELYELFLQMLTDFGKTKEGFQIIVTALDSYTAPELREYIGMDIARLTALQRKYGFVLQIEDPERMWSSDPMRYKDIGTKYQMLLGSKDKFMLDLNILSFRKKDAVTPFPTLVQTGTESFQLVRAAALGSNRHTIYSEASINPQDLKFLSYALASGVTYTVQPNGYNISTPYSIVLKMPGEIKEALLDGAAVLPVRDNQFIVPAGEHSVRFQGTPTFSTHQLQTRILSISGSLKSVTYGMRDVSFEYCSDTRTLASLNKPPFSVKLDDEDYQSQILIGNNCYTIMLPPGTHNVKIVTGDAFSYGVSVTSLWSSTFIAIFGTGAVLLLLTMYFGLKILKRSTAVQRTV